MVEHDSYDRFWQSRAIRHHLNNVRCAVLVVGGWFDCEDQLGPFAVFEDTRRRNPAAEVSLCVGPWAHAQWSGGEGVTSLGNVGFATATEEYYRAQIELPFLRRHLMEPREGAERPPALETAVVYEVGTNRWRRYAEWPPAEAVPRRPRLCRSRRRRS